MKNFITRAFTSIFIFLIFALIIVSSFYSVVFEVTIAALCVMCVYESLNAQEFIKNKFLLVPPIIYSFITPVSFAFCKHFNASPYYSLIAFTFLFVLIFIVFAMKNFENLKYGDCCAVIFSTIVITMFLSNIIFIRTQFKHGLFYMILAICCYAWSTDIFAYIVGVCIGKHRFSPNISPKKSIEGSIGGTLCCVIFSFLAAFVYSVIVDCSVNYYIVVVYALMCSIVGQIGDFSFSYIKRSYKIKDFGNLLPGHGGVLDRLDSLIFISPFFYMLLTIKEFII